MFRIVQLQGQLFICTKQNGSCCCGWSEKRRLPFEPQPLWGDEWERRGIRNRLHLTFTGCLGPCAVGNNALLQLMAARSGSDLNDPALVPLVFEYRRHARRLPILPSPTGCGATSTSTYRSAGHRRAPLSDDNQSDTLDGFDPVCLMDVDQRRHRTPVNTRVGRLCFAPRPCKKQFVADPSAYLSA